MRHSEARLGRQLAVRVGLILLTIAVCIWLNAKPAIPGEGATPACSSLTTPTSSP